MKITRSDIDSGRGFDWGQTSEDYAKFRDIYPDEFYQKLLSLGLGVKGQRVLDLGTGTGVLPRNMYKYGARFAGADISENQIKQARRLAEEAGMEIEFVVASAENFIFPDQSFDVVTACQCFMYFDKEIAPPRIHRALKDGGHFCILYMCALPEESEIVRESERLVLKYNPAWNAAGFKRWFDSGTPAWAEKLFTAEYLETFDVNVSFTRYSWNGRMRACRGVGASSMSEAEIARWEAEHLNYLESVPETFAIPHFISVMNLRKK